MSDTEGVMLCAIFRVPLSGLPAFQSYEDAVLPLLDDHGARLRRRLRAPDQLTEVHLIWFPSASRLESYRADPRRARYSGLFADSGATVEVIPVTDVAAN